MYFQILVDGELKSKLSSPHIAKSLVGKLPLGRTHKIVIQSYTPLGEVSRGVEAYYDDLVPDIYSDTPDDVDRGSQRSGHNLYDSNQKKKVIFF